METIITIVVRFEELPEKRDLFQYPEIQEYLDKGYSIKSIIQNTLQWKEKTTGFVITVALYNPS